MCVNLSWGTDKGNLVFERLREIKADNSKLQVFAYCLYV